MKKMATVRPTVLHGDFLACNAFDEFGVVSRVRAPALVIHGLADTMCDPSGGRATAAAIPGAELVLIEGMGHNLPPGVWERLAEAVAAVVRRGEARSR